MSQSANTANSELEKLSETGLTLADARQDIRGRKVIDASGEDVGHIGALFIDRAERKVRMLEIRAGGFLGLGDRHFLLPVEAITSIANDEVHINQTRDRIVHSPAYDPVLEVAPTPEYWGSYYGYYGMSPFLGPGFMYPNFSSPGKELRGGEQGDHTDLTHG
ncbi:MAG: PRC-barrel domain-containing protein [Pseudomonadota bacterium]|nr:PRC-barrel domain-containing protein [Pseudomonadota bacterium]